MAAAAILIENYYTYRRKDMQTYRISFQYSRDGRSWTSTTASVKATSDSGAISQIESKYPYVRNIKIMSVK